MTESYIFSFYRHEETPYINKRKWWNIFGSDKLEYRKIWKLYIYTGLSKEEADMINSPALTLIAKLMGTISNVTLEVAPFTTSYIETKGVK